jgi:hypothetical protein
VETGRKRHIVRITAGLHAFTKLGHDSRIPHMNPTSHVQFERPRLERRQRNHCSPAAGSSRWFSKARSPSTLGVLPPLPALSGGRGLTSTLGTQTYKAMSAPPAVWEFQYFAYVDAPGYQYPIGNAGAGYVSSSGGPYCPTSGPQPAVLPLGPTGADAHVMINFYPAYGGSGSAVITEQ